MLLIFYEKSFCVIKHVMFEAKHYKSTITEIITVYKKQANSIVEDKTG